MKTCYWNYLKLGTVS